MRMVRSVLVVLALACVAAASAAAATGPVWPVHAGTTAVASSDYPWVQPVFGRNGVPQPRAVLVRPLHPGVQPVWVKVGGLMLPVLPR